MASEDSIVKLASLLARLFQRTSSQHGEMYVEDAVIISRHFADDTVEWQVTKHDPGYLFSKLGLEPTESEVITIGVQGFSSRGRTNYGEPVTPHSTSRFIIEMDDDTPTIYTPIEWAAANA